MKKFVLVLLCLLLCGCNSKEIIYDRLPPPVSKVNKKPEVTSDIHVTFNEESLKNYLDDFSVVSISQVSADGKLGSKPSSTSSLSATIDIAGKIVQIDSPNGNMIMKDYETGKTYKLDDSENWVESNEAYIDFSKEDLNSLVDVYKVLLGSYSLSDFSKGVMDALSVETYELTRASLNIEGLDYDSLGDEIVRLKFENIEGELKPLSIEKEVEYCVGGNKYVCSKTLKFASFSNENIKKP